MPKPLVSSILTQVRSILADDEVSGGALYTDTKLLPSLQAFYRFIYKELALTDNPVVYAEAYYELPANTIQLDPATASITDVGEIMTIEDRKPDAAALAVSGQSASSNVLTLTTAAHGRVAGDTVVVYGLGGLIGANGMWTVAVPSATTLTLNGSYVTGTYTSGGFVGYSTQAFGKPLVRVERLVDTAGRADAGGFREYAWFGDVLRFYSVSEIRQLRITYTRSGNAPTQTTDTIGIDDSLDLLAYGAAAYATMTRAPSISAACMTQAVGPRYIADNEPGGLLFQHLQQGAKAMQGENWVSPAYGLPTWNS